MTTQEKESRAADPLYRAMLDDGIIADRPVKDLSAVLEALGSRQPAAVVPTEHPATGVCYRQGPITVADYDECIAEMQDARRALAENDNMGCAVCTDGHATQHCHHNALYLARQWTAATSIWTCFHCGFVATNADEGREHFGLTECTDPACQKSPGTAATPTLAGNEGRQAVVTPKDAEVVPLSELTSACEVMDLLAADDPVILALERHGATDAMKIDTAYALIADRKKRAALSQEEGA